MIVAIAFSIPVDVAVHPQLHKADLQMYDELCSIPQQRGRLPYINQYENPECSALTHPNRLLRMSEFLLQVRSTLLGAQCRSLLRSL